MTILIFFGYVNGNCYFRICDQLCQKIKLVRSILVMFNPSLTPIFDFRSTKLFTDPIRFGKQIFT